MTHHACYIVKNIDGKSIDLSSINRRRFVQGVSSTVDVSGLGALGLGKAFTEDAHGCTGVLYDARTRITQRKCIASSNYKPDGRLGGMLKTAGYDIPVGSDGRIKPNSSSDMWSYWIEKEEEKFQGDDQKLQIRLNPDGDRMAGWMTRPTPKFAKLSFSMNAVDKGATMDKIESALNPEDLSRSDENPTIPQEGVLIKASTQSVKVEPGKPENYLKKRGGE